LKRFAKEEFDNLLEINLRKDIEEFNNNPEYSKLRELYKQYFNEIEVLIARADQRMALDDISKLNPDLTKAVWDNFYILKEINRAISNRQLFLKDLK